MAAAVANSKCGDSSQESSLLQLCEKHSIHNDNRVGFVRPHQQNASVFWRSKHPVRDVNGQVAKVVRHVRRVLLWRLTAVTFGFVVDRPVLLHRVMVFVYILDYYALETAQRILDSCDCIVF